MKKIKQELSYSIKKESVIFKILRINQGKEVKLNAVLESNKKFCLEFQSPKYGRNSFSIDLFNQNKELIFLHFFNTNAIKLNIKKIEKNITFELLINEKELQKLLVSGNYAINKNGIINAKWDNGLFDLNYVRKQSLSWNFVSSNVWKHETIIEFNYPLVKANSKLYHYDAIVLKLNGTIDTWKKVKINIINESRSYDYDMDLTSEKKRIRYNFSENDYNQYANIDYDPDNTFKVEIKSADKKQVFSYLNVEKSPKTDNIIINLETKNIKVFIKAVINLFSKTKKIYVDLDGRFNEKNIKFVNQLIYEPTYKFNYKSDYLNENIPVFTLQYQYSKDGLNYLKFKNQDLQLNAEANLEKKIIRALFEFVFKSTNYHHISNFDYLKGNYLIIASNSNQNDEELFTINMDVQRNRESTISYKNQNMEIKLKLLLHNYIKFNLKNNSVNNSISSILTNGIKNYTVDVNILNDKVSLNLDLPEYMFEVIALKKIDNYVLKLNYDNKYQFIKYDSTYEIDLTEKKLFWKLTESHKKIQVMYIDGQVKLWSYFKNEYKLYKESGLIEASYPSKLELKYEMEKVRNIHFNIDNQDKFEISYGWHESVANIFQKLIVIHKDNYFKVDAGYKTTNYKALFTINAENNTKFIKYYIKNLDTFLIDHEIHSNGNMVYLNLNTNVHKYILNGNVNFEPMNINGKLKYEMPESVGVIKIYTDEKKKVHIQTVSDNKEYSQFNLIGEASENNGKFSLHLIIKAKKICVPSCNMMLVYDTSTVNHNIQIGVTKLNKSLADIDISWVKGKVNTYFTASISNQNQISGAEFKLVKDVGVFDHKITLLVNDQKYGYEIDWKRLKTIIYLPKNELQIKINDIKRESNYSFIDFVIIPNYNIDKTNKYRFQLSTKTEYSDKKSISEFEFNLNHKTLIHPIYAKVFVSSSHQEPVFIKVTFNTQEKNKEFMALMKISSKYSHMFLKAYQGNRILLNIESEFSDTSSSITTDLRWNFINLNNEEEKGDYKVILDRNLNNLLIYKNNSLFIGVTYTGVDSNESIFKKVTEAKFVSLPKQRKIEVLVYKNIDVFVQYLITAKTLDSQLLYIEFSRSKKDLTEKLAHINLVYDKNNYIQLESKVDKHLIKTLKTIENNYIPGKSSIYFNIPAFIVFYSKLVKEKLSYGLDPFFNQMQHDFVPVYDLAYELLGTFMDRSKNVQEYSKIIFNDVFIKSIYSEFTTTVQNLFKSSNKMVSQIYEELNKIYNLYPNPTVDEIVLYWNKKLIELDNLGDCILNFVSEFFTNYESVQLIKKVRSLFHSKTNNTRKILNLNYNQTLSNLLWEKNVKVNWNPDEGEVIIKSFYPRTFYTYWNELY